ncbi:Reductases [Nocardioides sp. PD653]|nr:Reductases [Nocardioides sp. PD653-B2]GAW53788.1 Reductases [Nocardioides sp. PD653]
MENYTRVVIHMPLHSCGMKNAGRPEGRPAFVVQVGGWRWGLDTPVASSFLARAARETWLPDPRLRKLRLGQLITPTGWRR